MLADQFLEAAAGARTIAALDETARRRWRAHIEAQIPAAEAEAVCRGHRRPAEPPWPEAAPPGRRGPPLAVLAHPCGAARRCSASAAAPSIAKEDRLMHWARCLSRRTEKGRAYGVVTAKAIAVFEALLWGFHNAKSGLCFPPMRRSRRPPSRRSTVAEALKALEDAGGLSWVHRLKRVRELSRSLRRRRMVLAGSARTSNGYNVRVPGCARIPLGPISRREQRTKGFFFLKCRLRRRADRPERPEEAFRGGRGQTLAQKSKISGITEPLRRRVSRRRGEPCTAGKATAEKRKARGILTP